MRILRVSLAVDAQHRETAWAAQQGVGARGWPLESRTISFEPVSTHTHTKCTHTPNVGTYPHTPT